MLKRSDVRPYPCHVNISTNPYDRKFVTLGSVSVTSTLARGCGKALVALHGIVNLSNVKLVYCFGFVICKSFYECCWYLSAALIWHLTFEKLTSPFTYIRWTGIESAWAQCIWAKLGGFAIMASATKGSPVIKSGRTHDSQHPWSISAIIFRFFEMSPARMDSTFGMIPGFFTMYWRVISWCRKAKGRKEDSRPSTQLDHHQ